MNILDGTLDLRATGRAGEYAANCPFCERNGHGPDQKKHLGVNTAKEVFHCFRCGAGGTLVKLVHDLLGVSYPEAREILRSGAAATPPRPASELTAAGLLALGGLSGASAGEKTPPGAVHEAVIHDFHPLTGRRGFYFGEMVDNYLARRGLTAEEAVEAGIGYCQAGPLASRVVLPVWEDGRLVGAAGRAIWDGQEPKYCNLPGFEAHNYLYNFDRAVASEQVVIMEGPFDALRLPSCAVALFGKQMSDRQKLKIVTNWKSAGVMLDRDAWVEAQKIAGELAPFMPVTVIVGTCKDPGSTPHGELERIVSAALGGLEAT